MDERPMRYFDMPPSVADAEVMVPLKHFHSPPNFKSVK